MIHKRSTDEVCVARRAFLQRSLLPLLVGALATPATAWAWPSPGAAGTAEVNVRDKGAVGDGTHDDTTAFQAAIDALPAGGGTVHVPSGRYLIDAARSIRPRSHTRLVLASDAQLVAMPNDLTHSYVVLLRDVEDVAISGGRIVGERAAHIGTTGEWGHGIFVMGARQVSISDIHISACWGDGVCIGSIFDHGEPVTVASDVTMTRVFASGNRRQGLSITSSRRVKVIDCHFVNTGGTLPGCGIDVEPGTPKMGAEDVLISGCTVTGNQGSGIQLDDYITRIQLKRCTITGNQGYGVLVDGVTQGVIEQNTIADNGLVGAMLRRDVNDVQVARNTFSNNGTRQLHRTLKRLDRMLSGGPAASGNSDIQVMQSGHGVVLSGNTFADQRQ